MKSIIIIKIILMTIIIITLTMLIIISLSKGNIKKFSIKKIDDELKKSTSFYDKASVKLKKKGINTFFRKTTTEESINNIDIEDVPLGEYYFLKIVLSSILFICGLKEGIIVGVILAILGYNAIDILMHLSNEDDNKKILYDIRRIYSILQIQSISGVFLTSSINECSLKVKNKRLKRALIILGNDLKSDKSLEKSIENFTSKFDNEYINTFGVVVKQSIENGRTEQIVKDLKHQVDGINKIINIKRQRKIDTKIDLSILAVVIGVIAVILICSIGQISTIANTI